MNPDRQNFAPDTRLMMRRKVRTDLMQFIDILRRIWITVLAAAVLAIVHPAVAQDSFPSKPIRIVIGFPAGGGNDVILRKVAEKISPILGVPVVVDNRAGANGNIAGDIVAKASTDGYTLLWNTSSMVLSPWVYANLTYDYVKDLIPVVLTANIPLVLTVPTSTPASNLKEFVAYLKANPGKTNYASTSSGNITHLTTVRFLDAIGAEATHVPYRGDAPVLADLLGGRVQFYFGTANTMVPQIKAGKLKGLAVTGANRLAALPDLPTLVESVAPGVEVGAWSGVMAPARTPQAVIAKLNRAFSTALKDPDLRAQIAATGAEVLGSTPEQYGAFLKSEREHWGAAVRNAGLKPE